MGDYGDAFMQALAGELRAARARTKPRVTIAQIMERTGMSKSAVLNYLNGKRDIPGSKYGELCRAIGVSPRAIAEAVENKLEEN